MLQSIQPDGSLYRLSDSVPGAVDDKFDFTTVMTQNEGRHRRVRSDGVHDQRLSIPQVSTVALQLPELPGDDPDDVES